MATDDRITFAGDVAGFFDPSPTTDLAVAGYHASEGEYFSAGASALGVVPVVGDAVGKGLKWGFKTAKAAAPHVAKAGKAAAEWAAQKLAKASDLGSDSASKTLQRQKDQVQRNKEAGDAKRDEIARREQAAAPDASVEIEVNMQTAGRNRRLDVKVDNGEVTGIESKVGRTGLTKDTRRELARDAKLLRAGKVDKMKWEFSPSSQTGKGGPTPKLKQKLDKLGEKLPIETKVNE